MQFGRRSLFAVALVGCSAAADGDGVIADASADGDVDNAIVGDAVAMDQGDAAGACIADNPPGAAFEVGNGVSYVGSGPTRAPGSVGPAAEPATAATIASECVVNGGSGCDASHFISWEAAFCLAELDEFEAGLRPWMIGLVYHHGHDRVVWNVLNVTHEEGAAGFSGGGLVLDATDGIVLDRLGYAAIP